MSAALKRAPHPNKRSSKAVAEKMSAAALIWVFRVGAFSSKHGNPVGLCKTLYSLYNFCLGFVHEHNRIDRDNHVTILWQNIKQQYKRAFKKYTQGVNSFGFLYDYGSVMHYGPKAFSKNFRLPTISTKYPGVEIGQRRGFSPLDILKIAKLYNCEKPTTNSPKTKPTVSSRHTSRFASLHNRGGVRFPNTCSQCFTCKSSIRRLCPLIPPTFVGQTF